MKKFLSSLFLMLSITYAGIAQSGANYQEQINEAWSLYGSKSFLKSAEIYSKALEGMNDRGLMSDRYNAACSWALAKKPDSSFVQLFKIAQKGNYKDISHISTDTDLSSLHKDKRWNKVLEIVAASNNKSGSNVDFALVAMLDTIYEKYLNLTMELATLADRYDQDSTEMKADLEPIQAKEVDNIMLVIKILDERGWLGDDIIGDQGNFTLFSVLASANDQVQGKYLPMMRDAVIKNNMLASHLAVIEDNVALKKGGKQIYGSKIGTDEETGEHYVLPLADPENVDKRRAEIGLDSLQWYIANWGLTWNVQDYKNKMAKSEKFRKN